MVNLGPLTPSWDSAMEWIKRDAFSLGLTPAESLEVWKQARDIVITERWRKIANRVEAANTEKGK